MSTALKRLIPFLVPFVVFLVAAALGGLAADQPENHQALAEPVTGVGEAGVSPVNEAGESYSSATSCVQEATAPGAVLLDAIDAESDKVDNQAEGGERMKKVEEELSLLRRELYDRTDRPGLKRAVILSLATSTAAESSDEDPLPAENATAFLGVTPQEEESDAYKHTLDFDAVSPRKNKNKENRISAPLKQSDTLIEESTSKTSEL
nr:dense granule protein [Toxoplasma gondii]